MSPVRRGVTQCTLSAKAAWRSVGPSSELRVAGEFLLRAGQVPKAVDASVCAILGSACISRRGRRPGVCDAAWRECVPCQTVEGAVRGEPADAGALAGLVARRVLDEPVLAERARSVRTFRRRERAAVVCARALRPCRRRARRTGRIAGVDAAPDIDGAVARSRRLVRVEGDPQRMVISEPRAIE
jgi:hypothetical protein